MHTQLWFLRCAHKRYCIRLTVSLFFQTSSYQTLQIQHFSQDTFPYPKLSVLCHIKILSAHNSEMQPGRVVMAKQLIASTYS